MRKRLQIVGIILFLLCFAQARAQVPVANFSANNTSSCNPLVVQFTDLSTNSPTSWSWTLGNGTSSTLQNPSTTYSTPGTYTVTLVATNASGSNTKTITNYITILNSPSVAFSANDTTPACGFKTVSFTDATNLGITGAATYYWDFGDGTSSASQNPTHNYTTPGTYSVSLTVTNSGGCSKTLVKTAYIKVLSIPVANFSASNTFSCQPPVSTIFSNTSTGAASYIWNFGDGNSSTSTSPSHSYTIAGSYTVSLIATSSGGCKDTFVVPALVNTGILKAQFTASAASICQNSSVTFTNTTTPSTATASWNFGDGGSSTQTSPTHTFTTSGTFTVKLYSSYGGCIDSTDTVITVAPQPTLAFSGTPIQACSVPITTNFSNTSTGATSYTWKFGDGGSSTATSPTHTYNAMGNYDVTLIGTSSAGCVDSLKKVSYVQLQPMSVSIIGPQILGCAPASAGYTASVISAFSITSYAWDFGDGSSGSGFAVNHTYAAAGNYTQKVVVTNSAGCVDSASIIVRLGSKPTAAFTGTPDTVCLNTAVVFTNTTAGTNTYLWLFGDGGTNSNTNTFHYYAIPGVFTVKLIANNNGCYDTLTRTNYITALPPLAEFKLSYTCANRKQIFITDQSIGASTYSWNFGDGSTSTAANPGSHTYATNGTYTISLTVTNTSTGCSHTSTQSITIADLSANFSASNLNQCKPGSSYFQASSTGFASYHFDFGDGITSAASSVTHNYPNAGVYTVTLVVKDTAGCVDSITKPNYVTVHAPTVAFSHTPSQGCGPLTITFTDGSSPFAGSSITSRKWDFGDGTSLFTSATTLTHVYSQPGTYSVKLTITETGGCTDSLFKTGLIVVNRPRAAFSISDSTSCINDLISFYDSSSGKNPLSSFWDFGDGQTSSTKNPNHAYSVAGSYTVKLVSIDSVGCTDTLIKPSNIQIMSIKAAFKASDTMAFCPPFTVNFTNNSTNGVTYQWSFGNGNSTNLASPTATYTSPGTYVVRLIATNAYGCQDSAFQTIIVNAGPTGTLSYSPKTGCLPLVVTFTSSYTATTPTTLTYDFDNGVTQTTSASSLNYTYTIPGIYIPRLILTNGGGCATSVLAGDTIVVTKINGGFKVNPLPGCTNQPMTFTDTTQINNSGIASHAWTFGDGSSSSIDTPTHIYTTAGTYTTQLIITSINGCLDTIQKTFVVNTTPTVSAANQILCFGDSVQLAASGASTYSWTPSTGLSATNIYNPYAKPSSTISYVVTGTSLLGCSAKDTVTVNVNPIPTVTASGGTTLCSGGSTTLTAAGAATYSWSPSTGLSATTGASVTANPSTTTTYTVTGTTALGCSDTAQVTIIVSPTLQLGLTPSLSICAGDSATLVATGAASYSWSPSTGLSASTGASVIAKPSSTTTYTVTGVSGACTDTINTTVSVIPLPTVSVSGTKQICYGSGTALTASGATSYSWTPASSLSASSGATVTATPTSTTTYTITGTQNGCSSATTATVTVNALPVVTASANTSICIGGSTTINAYGATNYSWTPSTGLSSTSISSPSASPSTTTNYVVTGTDANGCTDTAQVTVAVVAKPSINAGLNRSICPGDTVLLTASGGVSYVWTPGGTLSCTTCASPIAKPSVTTRYTVTGTAASGCSDTASVLVTVNPIPVLSISGTLAICANSGTTLSVSGAASYSWTPATGLSCTNCSSPTASPLVTTKYYVTGTSSVGCVGRDSVTVTVNPLPIITTDTPRTACLNVPVQLNASGAKTYAWSPAIGLSSTAIANPIATAPFTITYKVIGTDRNGCSDSATTKITILPLPKIDAGLDTGICPLNTATISASGGLSYQWAPAASLSCDTCATTQASPKITTMYVVKGLGTNGCYNADSVVVNVFPQPKVNAGPDQTICFEQSAQLRVSGAASYVWSPAGSLSCASCIAPIASPLSTTNYKVVGTDINGCHDSDEVQVVVISKGPISVDSGGEFCQGASIRLLASGGDSYTWSPSGSLSCDRCPDPIAKPDTTTVYRVIIQQGKCFTDTLYSRVIVHPNPTVEAGPDQNITLGSAAKIHTTGTNISTYKWTPPLGLSCSDCPDPVASPPDNQTYTVTVSSNFGCTGFDTIRINVRCDGSQIWLPNTFTPNADGENDFFYPHGKGIKEIKRFRIYDRWGELIFDRMNMPINDRNAGWDGTYKNQQLKPDVFVWVLNAVCSNGTPLEVKGDISLIR